MAIWYILWSFGIFLPILVCCTKKNLATLVYSPTSLSADKKTTTRGFLLGVQVNEKETNFLMLYLKISKSHTLNIGSRMKKG
jgi:hypothetical protein